MKTVTHFLLSYSSIAISTGFISLLGLLYDLNDPCKMTSISGFQLDDSDVIFDVATDEPSIDSSSALTV